MVGKIVYFTLCLFLIIQSIAQAQVFKGIPFIHTYNSSEYNAGIQNWEIGQDKRGLLYFANNFGLLEYDGSHWKTYPVKAGVKVRCLSIGKKGRIYVGLQNEFGYFIPAREGVWKFTSLADSLPASERDFDETWRIYQLNDKVYFCTFQKIYVFDGKKIEVINPENPIEFSFLADNRLYVLDWEQGLTYLDDEKLIPVYGGDFFRHKRIVAILPYDQRQLLIVTQKYGLFLYNGHKLERVATNAPDIFSSSLINCAIRLKNGSFVVGTQSNGLFLLNYNLQLEQNIDKRHGLNDHTVVSLFEDNHQNLWVGHNNGISYVELSSPFTLLDEKIGVPGSGYAATLFNNKLYLGTNNGLYVGEQKGWSGIDFREIANTQGQVYHVSPQGNDLLMGHHNGAFVVKNNLAIPISESSGSWQFRRFHNNPEFLLEGGYFGFSLYSLSNGSWIKKKKFTEFEESSRIFEEDAEGYIWMTHGYKGVYKLKFDEATQSLNFVRFYGQEDGLPSNVLNNVYKINNELVFTAETGVYNYDPASDRFKMNENLTNIFGRNEHILKLSQDANGKIYFLGNNKLGSVRQDEFGNWEADTSRFNKVHKLLNDDLDFLGILNNQNIVFGAKEGFIHYDPSLPTPKPSPLNVYIRQVRVHTPNDSLLFGGNFWFEEGISHRQSKSNQHKLPYESNSLSFQFATPFYDGSEYITYQYMLDGFDEGWSTWTGQTLKEYTNLPEGDYSFNVKSRNIYGEVSDVESYKFAILPPWYRASWAYLIYSLIGVSFIFSGIFFLDRKYTKEKELMRVKQLKALEQKKLEIDDLTKKTEEEIVKLKNEKLESEIRHKNKELATSTMHIVSKNEFIGEIKHHLNSIIKDSSNKVVSKDLGKIIKEIDHNIATDKDWEHFQIHFDRVHGDFSKRLKQSFPDLTPQEMKLCAYLRLNLSTKEIAQLMHISVRGVEISRYRLRKKLNLDRNDNLLDFVLNF